ncbi:CDC48 family AAA ATPase [Candidatus Woesearchaeota archaeon]|nr:CDC48 family AAA ATPase [Candidatus Woesearchaeota archaeon]
MTKEIKLKVVESIQEDVNKGVVRIDSTYMKELNVKRGDFLELEGGRKTYAIVDRALPADVGRNVIRVDGLIRHNAKTAIGDMVTTRKAEIKEAKKITIAPIRGIFQTTAPQQIKRDLLGRVVIKGDIISPGGSQRRRAALSGNPFIDFESVFKLMEENHFGFVHRDIRFVVAETTPKQPVIITDNTELTLNPKAVEVKEDTILEVTYEDIGGLQEEIKKIREMVELPLRHPEIFERLGVEPPKGVLLHGPPGTGKTLLAKAVANETNSHFIVINGPEIMSKYYGQSEENLRKKFEEAEQNAPSIIFIDEVDAIATKREETKGEVERRVVAQLLALMDGLQSRGKVVVIAATNVPNILDPALRRPGRFDRELEIGVPNKEGRENILKIHTRHMPLAKDVNLKDLAARTHGFVGADVAALSKEAAMIVLRRLLPDLKYENEENIPKEFLEKLKINKEDFKEALKVVRPSALREVLIEVPNVKWENIGGLDNVRQELIEAIEWPLKHPDAFKRMGVKPPKGILLYGAPGTGKTLIAKAVAHESEANFISVKGPELLSKWVGESEKAVREIFKKARQTAPTIVFFDEIDSLVPRRAITSDSHVTERVVNQLLTEIDGLEDLHDILIIGATNRPDMLDTALLRPGRFDRIILTPAPDIKSRQEIFKIHTKGMPIKGITSSELAEKTQGYVGADIEAVCREAAIIALRENMEAKEITKKHFEKAIEKIRPSITEEIEKAYKELKEHFTSAKAKEMQISKPAYFG